LNKFQFENPNQQVNLRSFLAATEHTRRATTTRQRCCILLCMDNECCVFARPATIKKWSLKRRVRLEESCATVNQRRSAYLHFYTLGHIASSPCCARRWPLSQLATAALLRLRADCLLPIYLARAFCARRRRAAWHRARAAGTGFLLNLIDRRRQFERCSDAISPQQLCWDTSGVICNRDSHTDLEVIAFDGVFCCPVRFMQCHFQKAHVNWKNFFPPQNK
jgi:hypothetical protein